MRLLLSTILFLVLSLPVVSTAAADEFVYSPEGCDFKMTFPDEPHAARRCHDKIRDKCDLMTSYTQVFGLDTTVNFYVSCTPAEKDFRKEFTSDLMRTSLLARPNIDLLEAYDISYQETDDAAMAALLGAGESPNGNDQMLYVVQLWVGEHSTLNLEAELIGAQTEESDKYFATVLRSLMHKNAQVEAMPPSPVADSAPEEAGESTPEPAPDATDSQKDAGE